MRTAGSLSAMLLAGCTALNPAFGDDGGGTSVEGESASATSDSDSRPVTSSSTGRPDTDAEPDPDTGNSTTRSSVGSGSETSSSTGAGATTGERTEPEPFRVSITFTPRPEPLTDFVARVRIDQPYLVGVPTESIDFRHPDTAARIPFEVIESDTDGGHFDAWVLLEVWDDERNPTVIDLITGTDNGPPESPWASYEHVWHLDDEDVLRDTAGTADGVFSGYEDSEGLVTGVVDGARAFDADNDVAEVPMIAEPSSSVVAYGWARLSQLPSGEVPLFSRGDGSPDADLAANNGVDWAITIDDAAQVRLVARVTPGVALTTSSLPVPEPVDGWHHYGFVSDVDGNLMSLFVDGATGPAIISTVFTELSAQSLSIGRWYGEPLGSSSAALEGAVDELTVLHRDVPFNWMNTTRINQQDPADTYTLGEKQRE